MQIYPCLVIYSIGTAWRVNKSLTGIELLHKLLRNLVKNSIGTAWWVNKKPNGNRTFTQIASQFGEEFDWHRLEREQKA